MEIFKLFGSIFVDTDKADKSMQKTESLATKLGNGMKTAIQTGLKFAAGIGAAATAAGAAITSITENTREYRNEMAKLDTAFQDAEHSTEDARTTYKSLQRILGETDQAVEAANHLAELCDTQEQLSTWTTICTGVYAKFGASLPIEGLTEAANETAKVGTLTGVLADALNWAGMNEETFQEALDKCNTEQERQQLITETLNGLYKDAADLYNKNNESVLNANSAQERLNETLALAGEKLEPVVTNIKLFGVTLLEKAMPAITSFITESDAANIIMDVMTRTVDLLEKGYDGLKTITEGVIGAWQQAVEWGKKHETSVLMIAIAVGTLTAALLTYNSVKITKKALDIAETIAIYALIAAEHAHTLATTAATAATTAFGAVLSFITSPITLVTLAIGALIAIGVALFKNWDVVKEKATELWAKITDVFENMKNTVSIITDAMSIAFENAVDGMKEKALSVFKDMVTGIVEKVKEAKDFVASGIEFIKGLFDFEWSLPELKLPHFSISGGFSLNPLQVPSIGVDWYDKAMDTPMILDEATVFGINSVGEPMVGGETGSEVVSGTATLMRMISEAMASQNEALIAVLYMILEAIVRMDKNMGGNLKEALVGMCWKMNDREMARWIREVLA